MNGTNYEVPHCESANIITVIKSRRLKRTRHVARMGDGERVFKINRCLCEKLRLIQVKRGLLGNPCEWDNQPSGFISYGISFKYFNYLTVLILRSLIIAASINPGVEVLV